MALFYLSGPAGVVPDHAWGDMQVDACINVAAQLEGREASDGREPVEARCVPA